MIMNKIVKTVLLSFIAALLFSACSAEFFHPGEERKPTTPPIIPIIPPEEVEIVTGVWKWAIIDDSNTNEWKETDVDPITKQSIFPPGGASRILNAVNDPVETDRYGNPIKRPFIYPLGTVKDNNGNTIDKQVFNLKGNTKVTNQNRPANEGAWFPQIGWEAIPDAETLELLKTAYGFQFWIRLNSSTANNWSFLTSVLTDFPLEEGHEYAHFFGNQPGDSMSNNLTSKMAVGTWYQVHVIMDKGSDFNIAQARWIHLYNPEFEGPFNQDKAQKIQWQIHLQYQVGAGVAARGSEPYDIFRGSYDFDVDFYSLELIKRSQ
jgi:hypothetical protein